MGEMDALKVYPHRAKANAKAKKIKEQSEEIKEQTANIKENFAFTFAFAWSEHCFRGVEMAVLCYCYYGNNYLLQVGHG